MVLQELNLGEKKSTACSGCTLRKLTQGDPDATFFAVSVISLPLFLFSTDYSKLSSSESHFSGKHTSSLPPLVSSCFSTHLTQAALLRFVAELRMPGPTVTARVTGYGPKRNLSCH